MARRGRSPPDQERRKRTVKVIFVLGTRPEAVKQAPLIRLAQSRGTSVEPIVVSTGQHRDMVRPILGLFGIVPDIDLELMRPGQSLSSLASRALERLDAVLAEHEPGCVVVQGDTTTAFCAALAAFHRQIPVAHLEAGLRSDRLDAPFPEEANRRMISQIARLHLAPTDSARQYLERDRLPLLGGRIVVTGNTVIDALHLAVEEVTRNPPDNADYQAAREWKDKSPANRLVLVTGHRRENFGGPFREFCLGLRDLARQHPEAMLLYPVHLNPNVQDPVREILGEEANIRLAPVADYTTFVALMELCDLIITDSGGVQEEAPALGKPVLVTRDVTERPEAVEAGGVILVGPHRQRIVDEAHHLLSDEAAHAAMAVPRSPYGDGHAAEKCLAALEEAFGGA